MIVEPAGAVRAFLAVTRAGAQLPGPCQQPASERAIGIGCDVASTQSIGELSDAPI
jgi:predicted transcriptional regulator